MPRHLGAVELGDRRFDGDPPSIRHRVPRVQHQVEHHLLYLARIGVAAAGTGFQPHLHFVVLAHRSSQHRQEVQHRGVEVDRPGMQHLLPAERQQLPGDVRRPARRFHYLVDVGRAGIALIQALEQEVAEAQDCGHHVVHFVGHTTGQPPRGLHPLGPPQLLVHPPPLGDVRRRDAHPHSALTIHHDRRERHLERGARAVPLHRRALDGYPLARHRNVERRALQQLQLSRPAPHAHPPAAEFLRPRRRRVVKPNPSLHIKQDQRLPRAFEDRPEVSLRAPERRLGPLLLSPGPLPLHGRKHCRPDPRQVALEQVIGGTRLHALDRGLLVDRAGDNDERHRRRPGPGQLQSTHSIELG